MKNAFVGDKQVVKVMLGERMLWQKIKPIGYVVGEYIQVNWTDEVLRKGNGTVTTEWIPVKPSTTYSFLFSSSTRCRIQSRDANGVISYMAAASKDSSADGLVLTTLSDAAFVRIYFLNGYDGVKPLTITMTQI